MSTLTEKFQRLQELEKDLEASVEWFEQHSNKLRADVNVIGAGEGRNVYPPYWMTQELNQRVNGDLADLIQNLIEEKMGELSTLEMEFAQLASNTLATREGAVSRLSARMVDVTNRRTPK